MVITAIPRSDLLPAHLMEIVCHLRIHIQTVVGKPIVVHLIIKEPSEFSARQKKRYQLCMAHWNGRGENGEMNK